MLNYVTSPEIALTDAAFIAITRWQKSILLLLKYELSYCSTSVRLKGTILPDAFSPS